MPKQKSHSGSKKRFDITGSGRVKRAQSGKNHKTGEKPRKRKRGCARRRMSAKPRN